MRESRIIPTNIEREQISSTSPSVPDTSGDGRPLEEASPERKRYLTLHVIENETEFLALRDSWDVLAVESHSTIFQTFDWLSLWWKHYGRHPERFLHILTFRDGKNLVGIFPLFLENVRACGVMIGKRLRMLGCGVAVEGYPRLFSDSGVGDYLDIICRNEYNLDITRSFITYLLQHPDLATECFFDNVPAHSAIVQNLNQALEGTGFVGRIKKADTCPRLTVPKAFEEYKRTLKPQVRRQVNQVQKALGTLYDIIPVQNEEDVQFSLNHLIPLHQERWNRIGYPGLFADGRFENLQRELLPILFRQGKLWCKFVRAGETCIAVRIGFIFNNTLYDYLSGFDIHSPEAKRRPGNALLFAMIEDAISHRIGTIDLLRGDEAYKSDFADGQLSNVHVKIIFSRKNSSPKNILAVVLKLFSQIYAIVQKEIILFWIQYRVNGLWRCVYTYIRFRGHRLIIAFRSSRKVISG
jgi:CelD/BcsL family acetyltransferase involved in cellulose biosynthesis